MKKKLALLMAAVMTVSTVPMNVFAKSDNALGKGTINLPARTITVEDELLGTNSVNEVTGNNDVKFVADANAISIRLDDGARAGDTFEVRLENAVWFFRNTQGGSSTSGSTLSTEKVGNVLNQVGLTATYNTANGTWIPSAANSTSGIYYRNSISNDRRLGIVPYTLEVNRSNDSRAIVTILQDVNDNISGAAQFLTIPLPIRTNATDADVRVSLTNGGATVSSNTWTLTTVVENSRTNTFVDSTKNSRDRFEIEKLVVEETRTGAIENGTFELLAPSGFYFSNLNNVNIYTESDLSWNGTVGLGTRGTDYTTELRGNDGTLRIELKTIRKSSTRAGALVIENLQLIPENNTGFDRDVMLRIRNVGRPEVVTNQSDILVGRRTDYNISITTDGEIPTLPSGAYVSNTEFEADDEYHLAARIVFRESLEDSWNGARSTIFTLPDEVKVRRMEIVESEYITTDIEGSYTNTGRRQDHVTIDDNIITLNNITTVRDEKARFEMDIWLSIESGFEGDINLEISGSSIGDQVEEIIIAKAVNPVSISTEPTDARIGYQSFATADIVITENFAGALERSKEVILALTDFSRTDMSFTSDARIEVVDGDLGIRSYRNNFSNIFDFINTSGSSISTSGSLAFEITRESSRPSTIRISNVSVSIDRSVPETNVRPYEVVLVGSAIAENVGTNRDQFRSAGISKPYINVTTSASNNTNAITAEVRVTEGSSEMIVNGNSLAVDIPAYISVQSDSMMIPIRFLSYAFGIGNEGIVWDEIARTVTIRNLNGTVLQFRAGSDQMILNGVSVTMTNQQGSPVYAEMNGPSNMESRMFLPFRILGNAFDVPVSWDEQSRTAIYNER